MTEISNTDNSEIGVQLRRIDRLHAAIRKHRDYQGDDRCHLDDGELYQVLPEGDTRPERDTAVELENCKKFIACRQQGRDYVSPQREIERLRGWLEAIAADRAGAWWEPTTKMARKALAGDPSPQSGE